MNILKKFISAITPESSSPSKGFKLEFRKKDGSFLFRVGGEFASKVFTDLKNDPRYSHKTKTLGEQGEVVVLECISKNTERMGYGNDDRTIFEVAWNLSPGDYIKVVY